MAQMNIYRGTLKVCFVLGGVALILVTSLQQSHALCGIIGCSRIIDRTTNESGSPISTANCGGGCDRQANLPNGARQQKGNPSSPCGPDCICMQAPDTVEAQRSTNEVLKAQVNAVCANAAMSVGLMHCSVEPAFVQLAPHEVFGTSAGSTCVRLCRFLI